jgi:hypothetical protein
MSAFLVAVGAGILLMAFIAFAWRQGMKVRPLDPEDRPPLNPSAMG